MNKAIQIIIGLIALLIVVVIFVKKPIEQTGPQAPSQSPTQTKKEPQTGPEVVAENLKIPWELAFLNGDEMLVTQRPGQLVKIGKDKTVIEIAGVQHRGEGGLLGLALHPNFQNNQLIYLYLTTKSGEGTINRVERYKLADNKLAEKTTIIDNIPGAIFHDGGRIKFGPDGKLYISTGDATKEQLAQDTKSLAGKILRINDDGTAPKDNPFGPPSEHPAVWSFGHRNPQGLAWDDQGRLWATEHGASGCDELNLIEKGKNYGWPSVRCEQAAKAFTGPAIQSGSDDTWAPAGAAFLPARRSLGEGGDGKIYFTGLRGETLYEADISKTPVELKRHLFQKFGRLRAVVVGPDKMLYITTSNTDGRGTVRSGDDKVIRVDPRTL